MKMNVRIAAFSVVLLPLLNSACQSANAQQGEIVAGANSDNGQAQRVTGQPNYGLPSLGGKKVEAEPSVQKKAAGVETPKTPVETRVDPCVAVVKSASAVGKPCETTESFVKSLGLSPKQVKKALSAVARADHLFSKKAAH